MSLYLVLLFILLTPGVLLTLPKGGKKLTVAAVHGVVFVLVYYLTYSFVSRFSDSMDGFQTEMEGGAGAARAAGVAMVKNLQNDCEMSRKEEQRRQAALKEAGAARKNACTKANEARKAANSVRQANKAGAGSTLIEKIFG